LSAFLGLGSASVAFSVSLPTGCAGDEESDGVDEGEETVPAGVEDGDAAGAENGDVAGLVLVDGPV
jgi:hypothetical protein